MPLLGMGFASFTIYQILKNSISESGKDMIIYKVFYKNYELKTGELMATLAERRKGTRGKSQLESGTRWAKSMFGQMVRDRNAIFVVPDKLIWKEDSVTPTEKLLFAKDQLRERTTSSHSNFPGLADSKRLTH